MVAGVAALPLGNLLYKAGFVVKDVAGQRMRTWSIDKFVEVMSSAPRDFSAEIGWTILIGGASASIALIFSFAIAWFARRDIFWAIGAVILVVVCASVPGPLVGLTVIDLLNQKGVAPLIWLYDRTIAAPVLAILVRCLPICLLIAWYSLKSVPQETLDSAASEGAGAWRQFWLIALPQRWLAVPIAWLATFAFASGDLTASILVTPPGVSTVPIRVFGMIHFGVIHEVASLSLTSAFGFALVASLIVYLVNRAAINS